MLRVHVSVNQKIKQNFLFYTTDVSSIFIYFFFFLVGLGDEVNKEQAELMM